MVAAFVYEHIASLNQEKMFDEVDQNIGRY